MKKFLRDNLALILILILGGFLIFWGSVPPSLNWDEASLGYNAYSILKTGRDEWGRVMPLSFEAFGDYKLPGYIYTLVHFEAIFGLHPWVVRLPSQLAGLISIGLLYLIIWKMTKNKRWAVAAGLLLAISPWHSLVSRVALEANLALSFFLAALYFGILGFKKRRFWLFASVLLGLSLFTYNSARLFIPLFLISAVIIYWKKIIQLKRSLVLPGLILLPFFLGAVYLAVFVDSSSRYYWISIVDQGAINYLNESRAQSQWPEAVTKLVFNRFTYFGFKAGGNYLSYFSPQYLFFSGGSNYQFSTPGYGELYLIEFPFLIFGLFQLLKKRYRFGILLAWFLIAPISASITREAPHVLRSLFFLAVLPIISGLGLLSLIDLFKRNTYRKIAVGFVSLFFLLSAGLYFYNYFKVYPVKYSQSFQYGMKQVVEYVNTHPGKVIYISKHSGEPHIFYLFFSQYDPARYQNNPTLIRYAKSNWRWVDRIDNIYFVNDWEVKNKLKNQVGVILITSPGNYPNGWKVQESIYYLDGTKAFDVVSA